MDIQIHNDLLFNKVTRSNRNLALFPVTTGEIFLIEGKFKALLETTLGTFVLNDKAARIGRASMAFKELGRTDQPGSFFL